MTSKLSRALLKYFYVVNSFAGFVHINIDFRKKSLRISYLRLSYLIIWVSFFVTNFYRKVFESYLGYEKIYLADQSLKETANLEIHVTFAMVILIITFWLFKVRSTIKLFSQLLHLTRFGYEPFNDRVGRQLGLIVVFGESGVIYLYLMNLLYVFRGQRQKMLSLNPFENLFLGVTLIVLPILMFSRFLNFFAFCIDIIRKFVLRLNEKISGMAQQGIGDIDEITQLYNETVFTIKLFEESFGWIIIILQCTSIFIGVNQVFFLIKSLSVTDPIQLEQASIVFYCFLHFLELYIVMKLAKSLQREGNKTRHLLYKIDSRRISEAVEKDIELFKLSLIHKPIEIQICGMFQLDYFTFYAIISAGVGYLIMLVQFHMASENQRSQ